MSQLNRYVTFNKKGQQIAKKLKKISIVKMAEDIYWVLTNDMNKIMNNKLCPVYELMKARTDVDYISIRKSIIDDFYLYRSYLIELYLTFINRYPRNLQRFKCELNYRRNKQVIKYLSNKLKLKFYN